MYVYIYIYVCVCAVCMCVCVCTYQSHINHQVSNPSFWIRIRLRRIGEVTDADGSEDVIYHFVKGTRDPAWKKQQPNC